MSIQCQFLGEFLAENCPDVTVETVIKPEEDWKDYINGVSVDDLKLYSKLLCPRFAAPTASTIDHVPSFIRWRGPTSAMDKNSYNIARKATLSPR